MPGTMKYKQPERGCDAHVPGEDCSALPTLVVPGFGAPVWHTRWIAHELRKHGLGTVTLEFPFMGVGDMNDSAERLLGEVETACDRLHVDRVNLVGYSMGGTIARVYIQRFGGAKRLGRATFVGAPLDGIYTGYAVLHTPAGRQVRRGSDFMRDLNEETCWCPGSRCLSIYLTHDIIILPSRSAYLSCGYNLELIWPVFHWGLVFSPQVISATAEFLEGGLPAGAFPGEHAGGREPALT
ncbi:MAG: alpha/beta fold hydrolase [Actinomycetota bacterium]